MPTIYLGNYNVHSVYKERFFLNAHTLIGLY